MVSCEWTGTMNLTEPHCGTDLGLMRTKAEPQGARGHVIRVAHLADGHLSLVFHLVTSMNFDRTVKNRTCLCLQH
jgi:hypothetical protein